MGKYVGGIEGSVNIDIKNAQSSIRKLRAELKQLEQAYKTTTDISAASDPYKELTASIEKYQKQLAETKAKVKELKTELKTSTSGKDETTEQLKAAESEAKKLTQALKNLKRVESELGNTKDLSAAGKSLNEQLTIAKAKLEAIKASIKEVNTSGVKTSTGASASSVDTEAVTTLAQEEEQLNQILLTEQQRLALKERQVAVEKEATAFAKQQAINAANNYKSNIEQPNIDRLKTNGASEESIASHVADLRLNQNRLTQQGIALLEQEAQVSQALAAAQITEEEKKQQAIHATAAARRSANAANVQNTSFANNEIDPYNENIQRTNVDANGNAVSELKQLRTNAIEAENAVNTLRAALQSTGNVSLASTLNDIRSQEVEVDKLKQKWNDLKALKASGGSVSNESLQNAVRELSVARQKLDLTRQSAILLDQSSGQSNEVISASLAAQEARLATLRQQLAAYPTTNINTDTSGSIQQLAALNSSIAALRLEAQTAGVDLNAMLNVHNNGATASIESTTRDVIEQEAVVANLRNRWESLRAAQNNNDATVNTSMVTEAQQAYDYARRRLELLERAAMVTETAASQSPADLTASVATQAAEAARVRTALSEASQAARGLSSNMRAAAASTQSTANSGVSLARSFMSISGVGTQLRGISSALSSTNTRAYASDIEHAEQSASSTKSSFKDISRVISGILISQAFYKALSYVQQMLSDVKEIYELTEEMNISFSTMFKNSDMGESFTKQLKNFASITPFTFADVAKNARMLSAYGFQANELLPVMQKLSDASAAMGSSDSFERVTRALGQIRTKGRLMQEELRQLNEAGIRTTDILMEKLGLTADQMATIGDLKIPADTAIKALLSGISDQYSGASKLMATTMKGMTSTLKDNISLVGEQVGAGFFNMTKSVLSKFTNAIYLASQEMQKVGFGGWINNHFSPTDALIIRNLAANFMLLLNNLKQLFVALSPVTREFARWMALTANLVLPILNAVNIAIYSLINWFLSLDPIISRVIGLFLAFSILWKVSFLFVTLSRAVGMFGFIAKVIIPAVELLTAAIKALALACVKNVWVLMLTVAAAALIYFALKSDWAAGIINKLSGAINGLFSNDPSKYFAPSQDNTKDWGEYSDNVSNATNSMTDLKDSTEDANKAAKEALASFDEVFNLNGPDQKDALDFNGMDLPAIDSIDVPLSADLGLSDITLPSIGQLSGLISDRVGDALKGAGIGALIGGFLGMLIGGPEGAKIGAGIGALVGGIVGWFWRDLSENLQNSIKGASIGAVIGGIIGLCFGNPLIGAAIGAAVGGLGGYFWEAVGADIQKVFMGAGYGAIIGGIVGLCFGNPLIGAAIGAGIGAIGGYFWDAVGADISNIFVGAGYGAIIGGIIGLCFGNPLIGAAIGAGIGGLGGYFWQYFSDDLKNATAGAGIGAIIGGIIGTILAPGPGTVIGIALGGGAGGIVGYFWEKLKAKFTESGEGAGTIIGAVIGTMLFGPGIGTAMGAGVGNIVGRITDALPDIISGFNSWTDGIDQWWADLFTSMGDWVNNGITSVTNFFSNVPYNVGVSLGQTMDGLAAWGIQFIEWVGSSVGTGVDSIAAWFATIPYKVGDSLGYALGSIVRWGVDFYTWIATELSKSIDSFVSWFTALPGRVGTELTNLQNGITSWGTNFYTWITTEIPKDLDNFVSWFTALPGRVAANFSQMLSNIITWGNNFSSWVNSSVANIVNTFVSWFQGIPGRIMTYLNQALADISSWGASVAGAARTSAGQFVDGFVSGIQALPDRIRALGKWIVKGLVDGLRDGVNYVATGISNFAAGIVDGFKRAFDINSPSRVMKSEVGVYVGQGTIVGIKESLSGLNGTMQGIIDDATKPLKLSTKVDTEVTKTSSTQTVISDVGVMLDSMLSLVLDGFFNNLYNGFVWLSDKMTGLFNIDPTGLDTASTIPIGYARVLQAATSIPNVNSLPNSTSFNNPSSNKDTQSTNAQGSGTNATELEAIVRSVVTSLTANMPTPVYAGTVIADKRSLKELNIKLQQVDNNSKRRVP